MFSDLVLRINYFQLPIKYFMKILLPLLVTVGTSLFAQKVYFTSKDFLSNNGQQVARIGTGIRYFSMELRNKIAIQDLNGNKSKIYKDSVWGYQNRFGKSFRSIDRTYSFQIREKGSVYIYTLHHMYWDSRHFSVTADGKVYRLLKKNLIKKASDKPCMKAILDKMKKDKIGLRKRIDGTNQYYLNKYIAESGCNPFVESR